MAPDEQEYLVENNAKGGDLMRFLRQKASVLGDIRTSINRPSIIRVAEYAICPLETLPEKEN